MKGLIIKDLKLMKEQIRFFIFIAAFGIIYTFSTENYAFVSSYLTFVCALFVLSTMSYDEFDNGFAFLFTLPFQRSTYVKEKYVFGLLVSGSAWILSFLITTIYQIIQIPDFIIGDWILTELSLLPFIFITLALMIPIQLKYGSEKSRFALFSIFGAIFVIGIGLGFIFRLLNIDISGFLDVLSGFKISLLLAISAIISAIIFLVSIKISENILNKKEF